MSAVPKQTLTSYEENLRKIAKLSPEHISAYSLIIEEGTPFYEDNKLEELLPSEEDEVLMYRMTEKILNEYGYDKYEISNYAKPGFESRHIGPIFRIWEWGLMPLRIWMRNVLRIPPI
jgi:oxygen-independent coproporphyrinogen-3 oxidase